MTAMDTKSTSQRYRQSPGRRLTPGPPIELTILGGAFGGRMIARREGQVVFVQGGAPGDTVRAELTSEKKNYVEARAVRLISPSPHRTVPPCPYFGENAHHRGALPIANGLPGELGACGGCQYQHLDYDAQLTLKADVVAGQVHRQPFLHDVTILPSVASPSPWRYRNRARWIVDQRGQPGYRQAASGRVLPVEQCHIVLPVIEDALMRLADGSWNLPLLTLVAEITARSAIPWTDVADIDLPAPQLILVLHPKPGVRRRDLRLLAADLGAAIPSVDGVVCGPVAACDGGSVAGLWGSQYFDARFHGNRFRLAPLTFFQVNEPAAELLVDRVVELLGNLAGRTVLDVYAGAGTFAQTIAARADQVLALEHDPSAVEDARLSARANGLGNIHVLPGDAEAELNGLPRRAANAAVLDPPRAGISAQVVDELARIEVPRIVYVSCDPSTLARDLARFVERGYAVQSVQPYDMFPQTSHIEAIAVLNQ